MSTKFYKHSDNLVLKSTTTITESNENANFPATNILDPRTTKVWKSTSGTANIVLDLGSAMNANSVLVVPSSITSPQFGYDTITIQANTSDSWGAPAFTDTLTPNEEFGFGLKTFATQNYRYWRLVFNVSSGNIEVSKVFLGVFTNLTTNGIDFGWSFNEDDRSIVTTNRYGQRFVDVINDQKKISASIRTMNKSELDTMADMFNGQNLGQPIWLVIDENENNINDLERTSGYFFMRDRPTFLNKTLGLYDMSFILEEGL